MNTVGKQYGFRVNAARCTGCKTCEMACRDAYQLGETPSFRRVCEASGGTWMQEGAAWRHQVFTYYLSIACNHCDDPVCQRVCPSGAMRKQDDGFVVLDSNQCIGCGSCTATCTAGQYAPFSLRKVQHWIRRGEYETAKNALKACMLCGKCRMVCPRGVNTRAVVHTLLETL